MAKKRLKIKDRQGNVVDYDIAAASVTIDVEGKSLEVKLTEIAAAILGQVKRVVYNGNTYIAEGGIVNLGNQMQPDWNESSTTYPAYIRNKPNFARVATSGSYNDLSDKPQSVDVECDEQMSSTSEKPVQNKVIKAYVDNLVNGLINNAPAALDTLNELSAALGNDSNFAATVTNSLASKVDKETGKGLSTNDYTTAEKNKLAGIASGAEVNVQADWNASSGDAQILNKPTIPSKTSDLTNDSGFVTATALVDVIAGNGDFALMYDQQNETYNIVRIVSSLEITSLAAMSASTKTGTFKVSGTHLKGDVTIALSQGATGWLLSTGGGAGASSLTLSPTNGTLAETTITVTYSGSSDSVGNAITVSSDGADTQTVYATYTQYAGPTILPAENSVSLSEVAGYTDTKTLSVSGANLTDAISAALSGTNASKFSVSGTLTSSGGTLTISYNPASGDTGTHSAVLTLSSSGASSVTVNLSGAVKSQTLSISPSTLDLSSASGTSASGTITVSGTNIKSSVSLSVGTGFTLSKNTLTATEVNAGETVTVTADTTSASTTITATDGTNTATASATWSVTEEAPSVGDIITKGGLKYKVTALPDGDTPGKLTVANGDGEVPSGYKVATNKYAMADVVIPDSITYAAETYNVTAIGTSAFVDCFNLKTVSIGTNVKTISSYAFYQCKNASFTSIALNNVTFIGQQAFNKCNYLANVVVTSTSLSMEQSIFENTNISNLDLSAVSSSLSFGNMTLPQTKLTRLDVGAGCSSLAGGTYSCQNLATVILRKTSTITGCTQDGSGYTSFNGRKSKKTSQGSSYVPTKVYVPTELKSTYEANADWATWVSSGVIEFDTIENLPNS